MILGPVRNLNTLQTIIHRPLPLLQPQPRIRSIIEDQEIPRVLLDRLRVEVFGGREVAVAEGAVAFFFELVGEVGHFFVRVGMAGKGLLVYELMGIL